MASLPRTFCSSQVCRWKNRLSLSGWAAHLPPSTTTLSFSRSKTLLNSKVVPSNRKSQINKIPLLKTTKWFVLPCQSLRKLGLLGSLHSPSTWFRAECLAQWLMELTQLCKCPLQTWLTILSAQMLGFTIQTLKKHSLSRPFKISKEEMNYAIHTVTSAIQFISPTMGLWILRTRIIHFCSQSSCTHRTRIGWSKPN